jgi:hypothetical protein
MERSGSGSGSICTYINAPDPDSGGLKTQGSNGSGSGSGSGIWVTGNYESILNLIRRRHTSISRKRNKTEVLFTKEFFLPFFYPEPAKFVLHLGRKISFCCEFSCSEIRKIFPKIFPNTQKMLCSYSQYSEILMIKIKTPVPTPSQRQFYFFNMWKKNSKKSLAV